MKKITSTHLGIAVILLYFFAQVCYADDNTVYIDQSGDNVEIDVLQMGTANSIDIDLGIYGSNSANNTFETAQDGFNNNVYLSVDGNNNALLFIQEGNNNDIGWTDSWGTGYAWGGDLDGNDNELHFEQNCTRGSSCGKSAIGFHIQGDGNSARWGQGKSLANASDETFSTDVGSEGGNHQLNLDIHGNNNSVAGFQRNGAMNQFSGHTATLYIYANDNALWAKQENDGAKTLNYTSNTDDNTGHIVQRGSGAHSATVTLQGAYSTSLNLLQQGTTAQSYTLFQDCQTASGCGITITQD